MAAQPILSSSGVVTNQLARTVASGAVHCRAIRVIHRANDGYVTLHRKAVVGTKERWIDIGSVEVFNLLSKSPELAAELAVDSYFSINSPYRTAPWRIERTGLPHPARQRGDFRWLNACYADLDCHRIGLSDDAALLAVMQMVDRGELLQPSIVVRSGRGAWLLWLLVDEKDRSIPQRAWPEKIEAYCRIQRAIVRRLANLGADRACVDVSRVMRVPGSLNTKASSGSQRVKFSEQASACGERIAYTLSEMASAVGVRSKKTSVLPTPQPNCRQWPTSTRNHSSAGLRVRWQNALADFETLRHLRSGFRKGCRTTSVLLYAYLLNRNGLTGQQVQSAVLTLAAECQPPLEVGKALRTMNDACKLKWPIRHATLARKLVVTDQEREHLTHWFPPARTSCRERITRRHALILSLVGNMGNVPSQRGMAKLLASNGVSVTARQVGRDYHMLQLQSCRGRQSRMVVDATVT
jgi:hypothetical protein